MIYYERVWIPWVQTWDTNERSRGRERNIGFLIRKTILTPVKWSEVKVVHLCLTLWDPMDIHGILQARILDWVAFPFSRGSSQSRSNPGLPHCSRILYQLSHKGSPRVLKWVAYPFSRGSSWPRNRMGVSCIAGRFFTNWAIQEAPVDMNLSKLQDIVDDRGAWHAAIHGVTKSWTLLSNWKAKQQQQRTESKRQFSRLA